MYEVTKIDLKNNRCNVLDTGSGIESICTKEQLLQSRDMGFKVFGVLPDNQVVVWDTFYKLSMLSVGNRKRLEEILKGYDAIVVTDSEVLNKNVIGNCMVFNMSNRTDMVEIFKYCKAKSLDLSSFDTSKVKDMRGMFAHCRAESLDLSSFDTSKVEIMFGMFFECEVESLDLRNFDTSKVETTEYMFQNYEGREIILSKIQTKLIRQVRQDWQGGKLCIR